MCNAFSGRHYCTFTRRRFCLCRPPVAKNKQRTHVVVDLTLTRIIKSQWAQDRLQSLWSGIIYPRDRIKQTLVRLFKRKCFGSSWRLQRWPYETAWAAGMECASEVEGM